QVSAFSFPLTNLKLTVNWANVTDLSSATIQVTPGATGDSTSFLNILTTGADILNDVLNGIHTVAQTVQQVTGPDITALKIPILNKSLGDILNGPANDIAVDDTKVTSISPTVTVGNSNQFMVGLAGLNLLQNGIAANDPVTYRGTDGHDHTGTIDTVD